jgi:hypothetical protein
MIAEWLWLQEPIDEQLYGYTTDCQHDMQKKYRQSFMALLELVHDTQRNSLL